MQGTESDASLQLHTTETTHHQPPPWWLRLILVGVVVTAFGNGLLGVFHFDDLPRIVNNSKLLTLHDAVTASSRPITDASFHANILLWGKGPLSFHAINIIIHSLSVLCLFELLLLISRRTGNSAVHPTNGIWIAFATSLLWAVHPTHTESVTYIVQRAELLSTCFALVSVLAFFKSFESIRHNCFLMLSVLASMVAMLAKPVVGILPFLILLLDATLISTSASSALRSRTLYYTGLLASLAILGVVLLAPNESLASAGFGAAILSPVDYWLNQQRIVWHYIRLWFHPTHLCFDYIWLPSPIPSLLPFAGLNTFLGIGILIGVIRRHPVAIALAAAVLLWLPCSSIVPIADLAAERRMYLPSIPLCLACVMIANHGVGSLFGRTRLADFIRICLLGALVFSAILLTNQRNLDYCSASRLQRTVVSASPHNMRARILLITALYEEGRLDQAFTACVDAREWIRQTRNSSDPNPAFLHLATVYEPMILNNQGRVLLLQGELDGAVQALRHSLHLQPNAPVTYCNLAAAHYMQALYDGSIDAAEHAIRLDPAYAKAYTILGMCYQSLNKPERAQELFTKARALSPNNTFTPGGDEPDPSGIAP